MDAVQPLHNAVEYALVLDIVIHKVANQLGDKPGLRAEVVQVLLGDPRFIGVQESMDERQNVVQFPHIGTVAAALRHLHDIIVKPFRKHRGRAGILVAIRLQPVGELVSVKRFLRRAPILLGNMVRQPANQLFGLFALAVRIGADQILRNVVDHGLDIHGVFIDAAEEQVLHGVRGAAAGPPDMQFRFQLYAGDRLPVYQRDHLLHRHRAHLVGVLGDGRQRRAQRPARGEIVKSRDRDVLADLQTAAGAFLVAALGHLVVAKRDGFQPRIVVQQPCDTALRILRIIPVDDHRFLDRQLMLLHGVAVGKQPFPGIGMLLQAADKGNLAVAVHLNQMLDALGEAGVIIHGNAGGVLRRHVHVFLQDHIGSSLETFEKLLVGILALKPGQRPAGEDIGVRPGQARIVVDAVVVVGSAMFAVKFKVLRVARHAHHQQEPYVFLSS